MKVINLVATVILNQSLDLDDLSMRIPDSEKSDKGAKWLKYRLKPENYYIAFYGSGKFLVTGVKSIKIIDDVAYRIEKIIQDAGLPIKIKEIIIQNFVCMDTINLKENLENLMLNLDSSNASYEPEQFPGLHYHNWGVTFLLFSSGKVIITGTKTEEHAQDGFNKFRNLIERI